ncbi:hypothetical protein B0H17DRAFT_1137619 [Mycena rosella]|uniref:Uncharacterized protein n=1 Tax=Mycena rosella TaxID=1033263 RepID=A0AAD7D845_MYCRO|nr:hypothetical protein B0H17DRAFT_1137619 [Mycena rosella]
MIRVRNRLCARRGILATSTTVSQLVLQRPAARAAHCSGTKAPTDQGSQPLIKIARDYQTPTATRRLIAEPRAAVLDDTEMGRPNDLYACLIWPYSGLGGSARSCAEYAHQRQGAVLDGTEMVRPDSIYGRLTLAHGYINILLSTRSRTEYAHQRKRAHCLIGSLHVSTRRRRQAVHAMGLSTDLVRHSRGFDGSVPAPNTTMKDKGA